MLINISANISDYIKFNQFAKNRMIDKLPKQRSFKFDFPKSSRENNDKLDQSSEREIINRDQNFNCPSKSKWTATRRQMPASVGKEMQIFISSFDQDKYVLSNYCSLSS